MDERSITGALFSLINQCHYNLAYRLLNNPLIPDFHHQSIVNKFQTLLRSGY